MSSVIDDLKICDAEVFFLPQISVEHNNTACRNKKKSGTCTILCTQVTDYTEIDLLSRFDSDAVTPVCTRVQIHSKS